MPLVINHGWPWTFWDMRKIIGPLSDPAAYGGDPADAFDVIAPSLPGFAFSSPLTTEGMFFNPTADLWVKLMARLGHDRFATQGGDIGAYRLGAAGAQICRADHRRASASRRGRDAALPRRRRLCARRARMGRRSSPRSWPKATATCRSSAPARRPSALPCTIRPVGSAAWLIDKRRAWSDCGGDVEAVFSKDDLITTAMLYWLTDTYVSSARHYYETKGPSYGALRTTGSRRSKRPPRCSSSRAMSGCNRANGRSAITTSSAGTWRKKAATSRRWSSRSCWWTMSGRFSEHCGAESGR